MAPASPQAAAKGIPAEPAAALNKKRKGCENRIPFFVYYALFFGALFGILFDALFCTKLGKIAVQMEGSRHDEGDHGTHDHRDPVVHELDGGHDGAAENSAGDIWLLPYWMGKYLQVID